MSSSVSPAAAGNALLLARRLHASNAATALLRLLRALMSSSMSFGETMNAAVRPCRVMVTGSRWAMSSNWPKRFWASTEVTVIMGVLLETIANLYSIAIDLFKIHYTVRAELVEARPSFDRLR